MPERHVHDKNGAMCNHVQKGKRPLRIVVQDDDGVWQFLCGMKDHTTQKQIKTVCIDCALQKHGGGLTRDTVPRGHIAERGNSNSDWRVRALTEDERADIDDAPEA